MANTNESMTYEYDRKIVGTEFRVYFKFYMTDVLELQLKIIQIFLILTFFTETKTRNRAILLHLCIKIPLLVNYAKKDWYFLTKDHICDFLELWKCIHYMIQPQKKV